MNGTDKNNDSLDFCASQESQENIKRIELDESQSSVEQAAPTVVEERKEGDLCAAEKVNKACEIKSPTFRSRKRRRRTHSPRRTPAAREYTDDTFAPCLGDPVYDTTTLKKRKTIRTASSECSEISRVSDMRKGRHETRDLSSVHAEVGSCVGSPSQEAPVTVLRALPSTENLEGRLQLVPGAQSKEESQRSELTEGGAESLDAAKPHSAQNDGASEASVVDSQTQASGSLLTLPCTGNFEQLLHKQPSTQSSGESQRTEGGAKARSMEASQISAAESLTQPPDSLSMMPSTATFENHLQTKDPTMHRVEHAQFSEAVLTQQQGVSEAPSLCNHMKHAVEDLPGEQDGGASHRRVPDSLLGQLNLRRPLFAPKPCPETRVGQLDDGESPTESNADGNRSNQKSNSDPDETQQSLQRGNSTNGATMSETLMTLPETLGFEGHLKQLSRAGANPSRLQGSQPSQERSTSSTYDPRMSDTPSALPSTYNFAAKLQTTNVTHDVEGTTADNAQQPHAHSTEAQILPDSFSTLPSTFELEKGLLISRARDFGDLDSLPSKEAPIQQPQYQESLRNTKPLTNQARPRISFSPGKLEDSGKLVVAVETISPSKVDVFRKIEASGDIQFVQRICRSTIDLEDCKIFPSHFLTKTTMLNGTCTRTFEYLKAMALGLHIVALDWVVEREAERSEVRHQVWGDSLLFDRVHEINDDEKSPYAWLKTSDWWSKNRGPCWSSSTRRSRKTRPLLDGIHIHVLSNSSISSATRSVQADQAELLCLLAGAHSIMSLDEDRSFFESSDQRTLLLVPDCTTAESLMEDLRLAEFTIPSGAKLNNYGCARKANEAVIVNESWLIDTISADAVAPLLHYNIGVLQW